VSAKALVAWRIERKREKEPASFAQLTLYPEPSGVQLDEFARDRQAQSGSMVRAGRRCVDLREFTKHQLVVITGDTSPGVSYLNHQLVSFLTAP